MSGNLSSTVSGDRGGSAAMGAGVLVALPYPYPYPRCVVMATRASGGDGEGEVVASGPSVCVAASPHCGGVDCAAASAYVRAWAVSLLLNTHYVHMGPSGSMVRWTQSASRVQGRAKLI